MPRGPGRDQVSAMERVMRLLILLSTRGQVGATGDQLVEAGAYTGRPQSRVAQLGRDIRGLRDLKWDIRNVEDAGGPARYVMKPGDRRLAVVLTVGEQEALRQAVAQWREDRPLPEFADLLQRAVERGCLATFAYNGRTREVHPCRLRHGPSGWYLSANETGSDVVKEWVLSRMSGVEIEAPGTARPVPVFEDAPRGMDPMDWDVDPPVDVVLSTCTDHVDYVLRVFRHSHRGPDLGENPTVEVTVTHREAFRSRLFMLGTRAVVVSPAEVRDEVVAHLRAIADGA